MASMTRASGPRCLSARAHEIVAYEHADRLARRVDHGDIDLAGAQQRLRRVFELCRGRERGEMRRHRCTDRQAARHGPKGNRVRLG
jgi:hypothetical protein